MRIRNTGSYDLSPGHSLFLREALVAIHVAGRLSLGGLLCCLLPGQIPLVACTEDQKLHCSTERSNVGYLFIVAQLINFFLNIFVPIIFIRNFDWHRYLPGSYQVSKLYTGTYLLILIIYRYLGEKINIKSGLWFQIH